jgi:two-component system, NtrC family, response regulator
MNVRGQDDQTRLLVIDDDLAVRSSLQLLFKQVGYSVATAEDQQAASQSLKDKPFDLIIMDMNFSRRTSGEEGLELLGKLRQLYPRMPVILITAWGSIPLAVQGMKAGAADFVTKPWNNEHLLSSVRTALSLASEAASEPSGSTDRVQLDTRWDFSGIIGANSSFVAVLMQAGRVAKTDAPVLVYGESGTGKELLAEAIHVNSARCNGPFVKVNLGGIPTSLFESEMFGHKRGAFTGAVRDRIGRFEAAHGGTIFLDEIGDLDANSQIKLLRVLQDRSFEVLGSSETRTADFRVVCATNRDIEDMVTAGRFREDLYYRINLITLRLPPLRQRRDDIPPLVERFAAGLKVVYQRDALALTPGAYAWLSELPWPGNVRELKNLVERTALVTAHDLLDVGDFQAQYQVMPKSCDATSLPPVGTVTIDELEKLMIKKAMELHGNNLSEVARSLGLSRGALYRRLEKYGLSE